MLDLVCNPKDPCFWEVNGIEINQIRVWDDGTNKHIETSE